MKQFHARLVEGRREPYAASALRGGLRPAMLPARPGQVESGLPFPKMRPHTKKEQLLFPWKQKLLL